MEEENVVKESKKINYSTLILGAIVIILLAYIFLFGNVLPNKNKSIFASNKAIKVLDYVYLSEDIVAVKIQNVSDILFTNVEPLIIFYDSNDMPIDYDWDLDIGYLEPGDTRILMLNIPDINFEKATIGFINPYDDEYEKIEDLRSNIEYSIDDEVDEYGDREATIVVKNPTDKDIDVTFEIEYSFNNKLIYADVFYETVYADSDLDTSVYIEDEYDDGTKFPEGFTYDINFVEAVEVKEHDDYYYDWEDEDYEYYDDYIGDEDLEEVDSDDLFEIPDTYIPKKSDTKNTTNSLEISL